MVTSESELKSMWDGLSGTNKQSILDRVWLLAGDVTKYTYDEVITNMGDPKTVDIFKNLLIHAHKGGVGDLYVKNEKTGNYDNRFYP